MAGRLLLSLTALLASSWTVTALPAKGDVFFLGVPVSNPDAQNVVPHRYIVVYNNTYDDDAVFAHEGMVTAKIAKRNLARRGPRSGKFLSTAVHAYHMGKMRALALEADDKMITEIFSADEVAYVEQDVYVKASARLTQNSAPTGLARLSHAEPGRAGYVFDSSSGQGITAYIVDTGIRLDHTEFEGRAVWGKNFVNTNVSPCPTPPFPQPGTQTNPTPRTPTKTATARTSPAPSAARTTASPKTSSSSPSRSSTPTAAAPTPASSPASTSSRPTLRLAASRARPS